MNSFLKKGDVIQLKAEHKVYADVPCHFVYEDQKGDFSLTNSCVQLTGDFDYLQGKYIVIETKMSGGGHGHGPSDEYPDGYEVTCQKEDGSHTVHFYQSGCFHAMIKDIEPIGKATLKWSLDGQ